MKKIALVGTAPSGQFAPFADPSWEVWGVGLKFPYFTRADRWFELHNFEWEDKEWASAWRAHPMWNELPEVWMFFPEPLGTAKIVQMNPQALLEQHGGTFFTSSFSWMIAQAIQELAPGDQLGLWGVDMEYGTEYFEQRLGLRAFVMVARALGISVSLFKTSGLAFDPIPYPFWIRDPQLAKIALRTDEARKARDSLVTMTTGLRDQLCQTRGALDILRTLSASDDVLAARTTKTAQLREQEDGLARCLKMQGEAEGRLHELEYWNNYLHQ